jgi:hypothetical protein
MKILNGVLVTDAITQRKSALDAAAAAERKPLAAVHIYNHLPPNKQATRRRASLDGLATKLAGITKKVRAMPEPRPASGAAQRSIDLQYDPTRDSLAEMNRRNRAFWHAK